MIADCFYSLTLILFVQTIYSDTIILRESSPIASKTLNSSTSTISSTEPSSLLLLRSSKPSPSQFLSSLHLFNFSTKSLLLMSRFITQLNVPSPFQTSSRKPTPSFYSMTTKSRQIPSSIETSNTTPSSQLYSTNIASHPPLYSKPVSHQSKTSKYVTLSTFDKDNPQTFKSLDTFSTFTAIILSSVTSLVMTKDSAVAFTTTEKLPTTVTQIEKSTIISSATHVATKILSYNIVKINFTNINKPAPSTARMDIKRTPTTIRVHFNLSGIALSFTTTEKLPTKFTQIDTSTMESFLSVKPTDIHSTKVFTETSSSVTTDIHSNYSSRHTHIDTKKQATLDSVITSPHQQSMSIKSTFTIIKTLTKLTLMSDFTASYIKYKTTEVKHIPDSSIQTTSYSRKPTSVPETINSATHVATKILSYNLVKSNFTDINKPAPTTARMNIKPTSTTIRVVFNSSRMAAYFTTTDILHTKFTQIDKSTMENFFSVKPTDIHSTKVFTETSSSVTTDIHSNYSSRHTHIDTKKQATLDSVITSPHQQSMSIKSTFTIIKTLTKLTLMSDFTAPHIKYKTTEVKHIPDSSIQTTSYSRKPTSVPETINSATPVATKILSYNLVESNFTDINKPAPTTAQMNTRSTPTTIRVDFNSFLVVPSFTAQFLSSNVMKTRILSETNKQQHVTSLYILQNTSKYLDSFLYERSISDRMNSSIASIMNTYKFFTASSYIMNTSKSFIINKYSSSISRSKLLQKVTKSKQESLTLHISSYVNINNRSLTWTSSYFSSSSTVIKSSQSSIIYEELRSTFTGISYALSKESLLPSTSRIYYSFIVSYLQEGKSSLVTKASKITRYILSPTSNVINNIINVTSKDFVRHTKSPSSISAEMTQSTFNTLIFISSFTNNILPTRTLNPSKSLTFFDSTVPSILTTSIITTLITPTTTSITPTTTSISPTTTLTGPTTIVIKTFNPEILHPELKALHKYNVNGKVKEVYTEELLNSNSEKFKNLSGSLKKKVCTSS